MRATHTFAELCEGLGRSRMVVRGIQRDLGLHVPKNSDGYSAAYLIFMDKIIALRTLNVPMSDIRDLFAKERRILEMLHFDSMSDSPTWYLDACLNPVHSPNHLLLTAQDLGFPVSSRDIQSNLDFSEREQELFADSEMGADVRRVLALYLALLEKVESRVARERPILVSALSWASQVFD